MGIWSRLFKAAERPLSVVYPLIVQGAGEYDYETYAREGYTGNPVVMACLKGIDRAAASVPWVLYRKMRDGELDEADPAHPLMMLLDRPNEWQGWGEFLSALINYKLLAGNAYVLKVGPDNGPPRELHLLEPHKVEIKFTRNPAAPVGAYEYRSDNGKLTVLDSMDVLHLKEWNPLHPPYYPGVPRLAAAALSVDGNNRARAWNVALLKNSARPAGMLVVKGTMSPQTRTELRKDLEEQIAGFGNAGRPIIGDGEADWKNLGYSPTEMDWLAGIKGTAREICTVLGYPPELLGDPDLTTYSNRKDARKALYTECVLPELDYVEQEFNRWLTPMFARNDTLLLKYDRDQIDALQEDRNDVWKRLEGADFISLNEKRASLDYEEMPELEGVYLVSGAKQTLEDVLAGGGLEDEALAPKPPDDSEDEDAT